MAKETTALKTGMTVLRGGNREHVALANPGAMRQQPVNQVRADETCSTSDEDKCAFELVEFCVIHVSLSLCHVGVWLLVYTSRVDQKFRFP